jgi:hypothetical protein
MSQNLFTCSCPLTTLSSYHTETLTRELFQRGLPPHEHLKFISDVVGRKVESVETLNFDELYRVLWAAELYNRL